MTNPIVEAKRLGQSFWYDKLTRKMLVTGELRRLVQDVGITGVTANPSVFAKAIIGTGDYDAALRGLLDRGLRDPKALYEELAMDDIRMAADLLRPVYDECRHADGFVSLEVSPHLAHDTDATVEEARRLFLGVNRQNVMIKVPGTAAGMPAIEQLVSEGVNVNVTLLFGLDAYQACAEAHLRGLERRLSARGDLSRVAGVASFFLSRIDAVVDEQLKSAAEVLTPDRRPTAAALMGKIAIANAKAAHKHYQRIIIGPRWRALAAHGAHPQRLLWASTGTKNPAYPKTMYVDDLIGADTVTTVPDETLRAYLQAGKPRSTLAEGWEQAQERLKMLAELGIRLEDITDGLLVKGVASFAADFDRLLATLDRERARYQGADAHPPSAPG
jgi:transaldolase / glucose-6-phosphate isomerase